MPEQNLKMQKKQLILSSNDREIINKLLTEFNLTGSWSIGDFSEDENLILINGEPEIKGTIIDLKQKRIVCPPYGRIDSAISNHLPIKICEKTSKSKIQLIDENFRIRSFDPEKCKIEDGHEGTIMRIWYDQTSEITRYSTKGKIDSKKSCWVVTKYFYDMYVELGGPTNLFDSHAESDGRNQVFYFLMIHPEVQVVSSENIGNGRLIFLGNSQECIKDSEVLANLNMNFPRDKALSIEEANQRLKSDISDYRIDSTNFIVITEGKERVKVMTPGYHWRAKLRNNQPNLAYMWYNLVTDSYRSGRMALSDQEYIRKYPQLKPIDIATVKNWVDQNRKIEFELTNENLAYSVDLRLHNLFQIALLTISPSHRAKFIDLRQQFFKQRTQIIDWLYSLYLNPDQAEGFKKLNPRIGKILEDVVSYAKQRQESGSENKGKGRTMTFNLLILNNIKNLIAKEDGKSLYRLVKSMNNVQSENSDEN